MVVVQLEDTGCGGCVSTNLVRRITSRATPVSSAIAPSRRRSVSAISTAVVASTVVSSTAEATSGSRRWSSAPTTSTTRHAGKVGALGDDLVPGQPSRSEKLGRKWLTLRFLPRNMLSLSTNAWATSWGSVNSTYAYLFNN